MSLRFLSRTISFSSLSCAPLILLIKVLRTMQDKGIKFSEAVEQAADQGFTEIDLREDLCGTDTARKVNIRCSSQHSLHVLCSKLSCFSSLLYPALSYSTLL